MAAALTVFKFEITLKDNVENCPDAILTIKKSILKDVMTAKNGPRRLTFVLQYAGTSKSLLERHRAIAYHSDVDTVRVFTTNPNNASSLGIVDPICSQIEIAHRSIRERSKTENLRKSNGVPVKKHKGARGKPIMGRRRRRKTPQNSYR